MGSSASLPTNEDGTVTIAKSLIEEHLHKFNDLESQNTVLIAQGDTDQQLHIQIENLTEENCCLKRDIDEVRTTNTMLMSSNTANINAVSRLQIQIVAQQETIDELTKKIQETKENVPQETKSDGATRMLTNELKQSRDARQALKKQFTQIKVQKDQLENELVQLKKTKLLAIQSGLELLNKRAETVTNKILRNVKKNNRESYANQFQTLKNENDRILKNLTGVVAFTTRFYQSHQDALHKLQAKNDKWCASTTQKIQGISKDCKKLINNYNSLPNNFLKAIADHTRDMDALEKVNFSSEFEKEVALQKDVLINLRKEREVLENILRVEKSNPNNSQVCNDKPNNLEYVNNLCSKNILVVRNMEEGTDLLDDLVKFGVFIRHRTGRRIIIESIERYGTVGKEPRPAKITLKTKQDLDDVLNSKNLFDEYDHVKVEKFNPKKKNTRKNVNADKVNK